MRKQFEELHPLFDLEKDEQGEYTCVLTRVTWLGFELGKKTLQAEIDQLNSVLDERTKEWLQAIECGTYFENVAKPLKTEIDQLKTELALCREENKGLVGSLNEQHQINIALNSETIKQREQIQHHMGKCVEQNKQVEEGLGLIKSLYKSEFSQRSNPSIHISQIREIEKALRGEHE